jgi:hypothetical protein
MDEEAQSGANSAGAPQGLTQAESARCAGFGRVGIGYFSWSVLFA